MAKKIDIGVNNVARNVKNAYIGVDGKARKIKAGWIGVGGVARQFYASEQLIPFTSSVVPTSWTDDGTLKRATSSNNYGDWEVTADNYSSTGSPVMNAFDDAMSSYYVTASKSSNSEVSYARLTCPVNVSIKPTKIEIKQTRCGNSTYPCVVQASTDNSNWIDLATLTSTTTETTETFNITSNYYYRYFRIKLCRYSSSYRSQFIFDFKITSGTLKIE